LFSSLLNKLVPFLLLPLLTQYLSPSEYGIIAIVQVFISLFLAFFGGLNCNIPRTFFSLEHKRFSLYMSALFVVLLFFFLFTVFLTIIYSLVGLPLFGLNLYWFLAMPVISCMSMSNLINLTLLRTQEKPYQYALWEISHTLLNLLLSLILVIGFHAGWEGRALGITVPLFLYGCLGMWAIARQGMLTRRWCWRDVKETFSVSIPLIPHALAAVVITLIDRLFISEMLGGKAVGIYSVGYQFGMVVMLFTEAFLKAWQPWFYKKLAADTFENNMLIVRYTRLYLLILVIGALVYAMLAQWLLPFVVDDRYLEAGSIILPVVVSYIAFGAYQIFFPYLVYVKKTYVLTFISPLAALVNIILNLQLIPEYGIEGAAYATIASYMISCILVFGFANHFFPLPWFFKKILVSL
jgi:O-antigen/teichoic acid export membrane protein